MKELYASLFTIMTQIVGFDIPKSHPISLRAYQAAKDNITAIDSFPELVSNPKRRLDYLKITYTFSGYESAWWTNPPGSNDNGNAGGVMQTHMPDFFIPGATLEKVRKDRVLGYQVGITVLLMLEKKCGTLKAALSAYATDGTCHAWTPSLVLHRCKVAGITCE